MRRAVARDFAALDGGRARVVVTLDDRLEDDPGPWMVERIRAGDDPGRMLALACEADFTVPIAPETTGILEHLLDGLRRVGARWLGSSIDAVTSTRDKHALAGWLASRGIDTPPCRRVVPRRGLPADAGYPAVLKPIDGAGCVDTFFVEDPADLPGPARDLDAALLQPYVAGRPMSASFLVDSSGRAWPIAVGEQHIACAGGRFSYRGGRIPATIAVDETCLRATVESVAGLRGFVGVDFVWNDARGRATILEINPRPTTSIIGITRLLAPGHLAAAWIGAFNPRSDGAALLPGMRDEIERVPPVAFDATGQVLAMGTGA
jgi:predicted ATP-grasp superfamily ATP-dependent carboligase